MRTAVIRQMGEIDATALLALGFRTIEVRTAFTPPVVIDLQGPSDPQTQALLKEVQPAIILSGNLGRHEIAPYGIPSGLSPRVKDAAVSIGLGLGAGFLGLMLAGAVIFRRR